MPTEVIVSVLLAIAEGEDPEGNGESDSASQEPRELTFVDEATFWSTF